MSLKIWGAKAEVLKAEKAVVAALWPVIDGEAEGGGGRRL